MNKYKQTGLLGISALFIALAAAASADIAAADNIVSIKELSSLKQIKTAASAAGKARYVEGEVIVKYKEGVTVGNAKALAADGGYSVIKSFGALSRAKGQAIAVLKGALSTAELMRELKADPNVEAVSPNYIRTLQAMPNDSQFNLQWGLNNTAQTVNGFSGTADADIDAPEAWDMETGVSDTVVAVFDTGVDYTHTDLAGNMWHNPDEIPGNGIDDDNNGYIDDVYGADCAAEVDGSNDGDPMDIHGHGTHVAGIIGAVGDNGTGVTGVNWSVKIMALKVFRPDGHGYDDDILEAIDYVLEQKSKGVNIVAVNASYAGYGGSQADPMNSSIQDLGAENIVFCAAAGNDANDNDVNGSFPASYNAANIISVAATDQNDALAAFSNYGDKTVDIAAPGVNIYSTLPGDASNPGPSDIFYDDFESGSHSWYSGGTNNTWAFTTEDSFSPDTSLTDSPDANYANNTKSYALSETVDLSSASGPIYLGFKAKLDVEDGYEDNVSVIMSPDGTNWYYLSSYFAQNRPWESYSVAIPDEFKTAGFRFGFLLWTNGAIVRNGVHIDDVDIAAVPYGSMSGTSMATPFVTGAVALLASAYPAETAAERRDRILLRGDKLSSLSGKTVTGARLNLNNAIQAEWDENSSGGGGGGGGGGLPVYDTVSLLLSVFGFLAIGGLIARRRLSREG